MSTARADLAERPLLRSLAENWWLILLRGVAALIFGILAFVWPGRRGAAADDRRLGHRYRHPGDHRRDRAAQGDRERVAADPRRRALDRLRRAAVQAASRGHAGGVWMIGGFAIVFGADHIALAFKLRKHKPA